MAETDFGPRIGADPELFVQNAGGEILPICGLIGGTKEEPLSVEKQLEEQYGREEDRRGRPIGDRIGRYAIQEDNVMLEFNIPAYKDTIYFESAIRKMITWLDATLLPSKGLHLKYETMHTFKEDDIAKFPQALKIGCLPDMNAYAEDGQFERAPFDIATFGTRRFCGGHLHVQYNHDNVPRHIFAQFMDVSVELPFLRYDKQKARRQFYGQPGIYREKPYGIEYRTPSNFWLFPSFREKYIQLFLENVYYLARQANKDPETLKQTYSKIDWEEVQTAIKSENVQQADEILDFIRSNTPYPPIHTTR